MKIPQISFVSISMFQFWISVYLQHNSMDLLYALIWKHAHNMNKCILMFQRITKHGLKMCNLVRLVLKTVGYKYYKFHILIGFQIIFQQGFF